ncbi:maleylpyruvate isomerase family mycothiol-dependent enzyme [Nocardioides albidus]|uniref:Maleylpyruvate isomerase family mycothiol-dependent enzyme n=1 Tax=Nocardioides albidus TaxID=1517589 RepID=A0A5C4VX31_9ACTN|nr:maleylpyruvate isomerase family mycothiol-dependent enzyme [Nocardioides albidus]TNM39759.1 maleylpyruvate isomerase family mycothiol-dependent enzyme [Nocardioides albidus]
MTRLEHSTYLDHLRAESARFLAVLEGCDPEARVPSCPDWDAADLLWHLGEVQHFWEHVVRTRPEPPESYEEPERPSSFDGLVAFFRATHETFIGQFEKADPTDPAWFWSGNPAHQNIAHLARRQAHEALIHRRDAELAAGQVTDLPAALAADGVDEILDVMYGGLPPWGRFEPREQYAEFRATDTGSSVWVQLGTFSGTTPEGVERSGEPDQHVVADPGVPADLVVTGTASDLDAWLWHRAGDERISITGDDAVRTQVAAVLGQSID